MPSKQYRIISLVLYPDDPNIESYLKKAKSLFPDWAYILHDNDINDDGTHKKDHIHFYGRLSGQAHGITIKGVSYHIGIPENYIESKNDWKSCIQYLTHYNDKDKAKYEIENIVSNFNVEPYYKDNNNEEDMILPIISYINEHPDLTIRDMVEWILSMHYWSAYRRNYSIIKDYIYYIKGEQIANGYCGSKNG